MKRLQILIEEELDEALAVEARRMRASKAELIRRYVRLNLAQAGNPDLDPLAEMVGVDDYQPAAIDNVVYR